MKNISKYMFGALLGAGLAACSPETFDGINEAGIPQASIYENSIKIDVDQSLNQVTFTLDNAQGVYPIWTVDTGKKSETFTHNGAKRIYTVAGDYTVTVQIGNRNGISEGKFSKTFHIDNSIIDFTPYTQKISKAPWFIDNQTPAHLGCGEPGTNGTNWWSASPDEKKEFGVYENSLAFTSDMQYTFDPGKSGTIYVNKDVTVWSDLRDPDNDFCVPVELQTTTYNFEVDGSDLYLTFPKGTYFPYIANDDIWNTPRYHVLNLTSKSMELVSDNGAIAWHYLFTTTHEVAFGGFDVNSPDNLWKQANATFKSLYYAHGGSWEGLPDFEHSEENGTYHVELPTATDQQWQAQYQLATELNNSNVPADATYDFSCVVLSNNDVAGMTIKLTSEDDQISLINERADIASGETVVYFTELPGQTLDGNYKLVFDFGGNPENTEITIKDLVLIDHTKNTITPPAVDPEPNQPSVDWTGTNLLAGMPVEITQYYAPGWNQLPDAEYTEENGVYTIEYPTAAGDQWQAQFTFNNTGIALDPEKSYDFRVKLTSTTDHPGVTVKLTQQDDDEILLTQDRHPLAALEETWIELSGLTVNKGQITNLKIPFDFGGIADGTTITLSDMYLQEHQGPKVIDWDLTGSRNLWLKGEHATLSFYYAPGWNQIADPETTIDGNSYTISLPEATSDQWQAQWHIDAGLTRSDIVAGKKYDIRFTIYANEEQPGITFKLTEDGNDENFLTQDRHAYTTPYEDQVVEITGVELSKGENTTESFKLALDFAGNPAGSEVTIKDIIIQEAE